MTRIVHQNDREAWLEARKSYLTASDAAALLGLSKYKTRGVLMLEKAGLADDDYKATDESTAVGLELEEASARLAKKLFGWDLVADGWLTAAPGGILAATPDFQMDTPWGRAVVNTKVTTCQAMEDVKPPKNGGTSTARYAGGCPLDYAIQMQVEMACTGCQWGAILALHCSVGFKLRAYPVKRNDILIAQTKREAAKFMDELHQLKGERK